MSSHNDQGTSNTFRLMYRSRDLVPAEQRKVELGALFTAARTNNKRQDVTGALLVADGCFVQVLEGDEDVVQALFSHIERDPRHDAVVLVDARTVPERVFARWAMAEVGADGGPDTPLIAHVDGISPASSRGTTAEQAEVLGTMRAAVTSFHQTV